MQQQEQNELKDRAFAIAVVRNYFGKLENQEAVKVFTVFYVEDARGTTLTTCAMGAKKIISIYFFYGIRKIKTPDLSINLSEQTDCFKCSGVEIFSGNLQNTDLTEK